MDPMGPNISDSYILLKPKKDRPKVNGRIRTKKEIIEEIVNQLESTTPGQRILISQPIQLRFNELMEGTRSDVSLKVFGEDQDILTQEATKIVAIIQKIKGAGDVELEAKGKMSVLEIKPKYKVLKSLGISAAEVLDTVGIAIGGEQVGIFYEGMKRFPIIVRIGQDKRDDIEVIKGLPVRLTSGSTIPLSEVASIHFKLQLHQQGRNKAKNCRSH